MSISPYLCNALLDLLDRASRYLLSFHWRLKRDCGDEGK
jgi:hypothetical protein